MDGKDFITDDVAVDGVEVVRGCGEGDLCGHHVGGDNSRVSGWYQVSFCTAGLVVGAELEGLLVDRSQIGHVGEPSYADGGSHRVAAELTGRDDREGDQIGEVDVDDAAVVLGLDNRLSLEGGVADYVAVWHIWMRRRGGEDQLRGDDIVFQGGSGRRRQGAVAGGERKGLSVGGPGYFQIGEGGLAAVPGSGSGAGQADAAAGHCQTDAAAVGDVDVAVGILRFEDGLGGEGFAVDDVAVGCTRIAGQRGEGDLCGDHVDGDAVVVGGENCGTDIAVAGIDRTDGRANAEGVSGASRFIGMTGAESGGDDDVRKAAAPGQRCVQGNGGR